MKENELRLYVICSVCHQPIGHTGLPLFCKVTIERVGILAEPIRRQDGLTAVLGGNAALAQVMGTDEEMTESIATVTLSVCEGCYLEPTRIAALAELIDVNVAETVRQSRAAGRRG